MRKCCILGKWADTGLCGRGKHNHPRGYRLRPNSNHATGTNFSPNKSTTKAVAKRMKELNERSSK